ncbi:hypothetical protein DH2020_011594 [Rehmannia glutinosa]|uniref:F5/8 type C domain-containing protein n=1 Tax=Rehmannia glutinosa TaxID=99300 RepID=A0ABR0XDZ1_REHGL
MALGRVGEDPHGAGCLGKEQVNGYPPSVNCATRDCFSYEVIHSQKEFEIRDYQHSYWVTPPYNYSTNNNYVADFRKAYILYGAVRRFDGYLNDTTIKVEKALLLKSLQGTQWQNITEIPGTTVADYNLPGQIKGRVNEIILFFGDPWPHQE